MFVDLVGSTALSAALDPEEMGAAIRVYQNAVTGETLRFEGHIAKFMGDGVLVYFGWPQAHEDDAERAVRAALALVQTVGALEAGGLRLAARIGIATGLVVVGEPVGEGDAHERAVVGETPNLAARLQALAAPGSVVISQATRRLVGSLFELADLGPTLIKGFAEPVAAFRVEGEGSADGRFEALHGQRLTPLIGREHQLAMLMERWSWTKDGDGQVVLIAGEAGVGKSRLLHALREKLADEPHFALSYFCSPYHTNSMLHPIVAQLERAAGFASRDEPANRLAKLEAVLAQGAEQLDEAAPLVGALMGVPTDERYPALNLSPQRQKQRTFEVLLEQLAGLARERPVLQLYEDLHWADPSTLELLDMVVERARALPVLMVITHRSHFSPPWSGQAHVTALPLNRLGRRQGAAMALQVTGGKALPPEILDQILERTDGVPLFLEELTRTMLESGLHDRCWRSLRACGAAAPACDPGEPARFADGAARPAGAGQGTRPDRRRDRARIFPRAHRRSRRPAAGAVGKRARSAGRLRTRVSPRRPARRHLQFQARLGQRCRLSVVAQVAGASSCTLDSRRCSRSGFRLSSRPNPSCSRIT